MLGCDIHDVQQGVQVYGGSSHELSSLDVHDVGMGGLVMFGLGGVQGRLHWVHNNHVWNYGRVYPIWSAGINLGYMITTADRVGVVADLIVTHNEIHDGPHVGLLYDCDGCVIAFNEIYDYATETFDVGGIHTTTFSLIPKSTNVLFNWMHDSPTGNGIYLDERSVSEIIQGNLVTGMLRCYKIDEDYGISITTNLAVGCSDRAYDVLLQDPQGKFTGNTVFKALDTFYRVNKAVAYKAADNTDVSRVTPQPALLTGQTPLSLATANSSVYWTALHFGATAGMQQQPKFDFLPLMEVGTQNDWFRSVNLCQTHQNPCLFSSSCLNQSAKCVCVYVADGQAVCDVT